MHSRTRRLLTGATLTLLVVACASALGASNAGAASRHATNVRKITACGFVAHTTGTYELTKNITDSGSGSCITIKANNVTLYLDGHTITGTGTDYCLDVEGGSSTVYVHDTIIGGTKLKPTKAATLTNCSYALYVYQTSGTKASYLKIVKPTNYGVEEYESGGMVLSHISVAMHSNSAYGFYLEYGADNVVTKCAVDNNSSDDSFYAYYEVGDKFTWDTAKDTYSAGGNTGTAFYDEYSARDTYSHDTAKGHEYGFYVYSDGYGPVSLTYDTASGPSTSNGYGYYVYEAYQEADYGSKYHTLVSHTKADGFQYGYYDESYDEYSSAETWTKNTANNYGEYGFYIDYTQDYVMTGNIADQNTGSHRYNTSGTYGFYLDDPYSYEPFALFANNQAYDSEYGFYSDEYFVGGTGNVAKRNKYQSYLVEISG